MHTIALGLLLAQAGVSLSRHEFKGITIRAPKSWAISAEDETSKEWANSDDRAQMAFSAFPVSPIRPARACVKQLLEAVQGAKGEGNAPGSTPAPGFTSTIIGGQPAAKRITTDFIAESQEEKTDANKVTTTTIVGCNGKTKWLLTFANRTVDGAKSGALLKRVVDSITYSK
jgi:hypothetical protein